MTEGNVLYYGDNLDILRHYIPDESVALVYLDPPFNSNATYNVIFKDESGRKSDAQMLAFDDTWHWGPDAERQYLYLTNSAYHQGHVPSTVSALVGAFHAGIRPSPMLAYLVEMAVRLVELRRVLKPAGSLYLHCDPTASHYLKLVLDAVFGPEHFLNEFIWKRTTGHPDARRGASVHDTILAYTKTSDFVWNRVYQSYDPDYVERYYRYRDADGQRFMSADLTGAGPGPSRHFGAHGDIAPPKGRHWLYAQEGMDKALADNRVFWTRNGIPRLKVFLDDAPGMPLLDVWDDIQPLRSWHKELLPYPTQKPLALLDRIISASSNRGDLVLDPFCGCGTALVAAQKLDRRWIGIDVTYLAIAVMRQRLRDSFPELEEIEVVGRPTEVAGARAMLDGSLESQYQFQWWALDLVGATPKGGVQKKGADKGIDGVVTFTGAGGKAETCIVSVKSGGVGRKTVQELKGDMESHGAAMGLVVTLEEPTGPMAQEAAEAGFYHSEVSGRDYPRIQVLTIRELLEEGRRPELPLLVLPTYQRAERVRLRAAEQQGLFGLGESADSVAEESEP